MEPRENSAGEDLPDLNRNTLAKFLSVALRIVGNLDDANDAVQSAMLKAWAKRDTFKGQSSWATWAHRIVVNEALMLARDIAKRINAEPYLIIATPHYIPAHQDSDVAWSESIQWACGKLVGNERKVFLLCHVLGYRFGEAARILGLTYQGARSAHWRVKRKFLGARTSTQVKTFMH